MKWKVTGTYLTFGRTDFHGRAGRWEQKEKKPFSIMASRFSEIFDMDDYPMIPISSGAGRDIVTYRLGKRDNGVVLEQEHIHSTKPISMWFRRAMIDIEINGKPATKEMLEKAVKFMKRKH